MFSRHLVKHWDLPQAMQHVGHHHNLVFFAVWGCNAESSLQAGLPSARRFWSNAWPKRTFSLKAIEILASFFRHNMSDGRDISQVFGTIQYNVCLFFNLHQNAGSWEGLMSVVWMFLQYGGHIGDSTPLLLWVFPLLTPTPHYWPGGDVMSGCYHLQSRYMYQFTWIHRIALSLLGKRDRQLWYLKLKQLVLFATPNGFFPTTKFQKPFFSFPHFPTFVCGLQSAFGNVRNLRQAVGWTSTFEIEGVRVLTSILFLVNLERNIFKFPTISCNYWCFSVSNMTLVEVETHAG